MSARKAIKKPVPQMQQGHGERAECLGNGKPGVADEQDGAAAVLLSGWDADALGNGARRREEPAGKSGNAKQPLLCNMR
jgi:hypothetical protein